MKIEVRPDGWPIDEWNMLTHEEKTHFICLFASLIDGDKQDLIRYREIAKMRLDLGSVADDCDEKGDM